MSGGEWVCETSCYPYSDDVYMWDGRNNYVVASEPCACGCKLARMDPDGEIDSDGDVRDLTRYWCADCGTEVDDVERYVTVGEIKRAVAESMFREARNG